MSSRRTAKAARAIQEVVSSTILFGLKDPRVKNVTVMSVEVTGDMRRAKVYVSVMGDEKAQLWLVLNITVSSADGGSIRYSRDGLEYREQQSILLIRPLYYFIGSLLLLMIAGTRALQIRRRFRSLSSIRDQTTLGL